MPVSRSATTTATRPKSACARAGRRISKPTWPRGYADIDRGDGDFYSKLGAQYKFNPMWGIAASATFADDSNEFFVGPRISF